MIVPFVILGAAIVGVFLLVGYLFFMLDKETNDQLKKDSTQGAAYIKSEGIYKKRILDLQEELLAVSKKTESKNQEAQQMVAALLKENEALKKVPETLQTTNQQLNLKIESLQYELIKLKAQSTGLERVNFNYKNQLEGLLKKTNV